MNSANSGLDKSQMVELLREPPDGDLCGANPRPTPLLRSLPYARGNRGGYVHRVRSGLLHLTPNPAWKREGHVSLHFWCGGTGFTHRMDLFATPPEGADVCATCEGRALGAGLQPSSILTASRPIKFSPRRPSNGFFMPEPGAT